MNGIMNTNVCKRSSAVLTACAILLIFAVGAYAQSLSLMAPSLANVHGRLTARFGVAVEEFPVLKGELEDGAVLELKCEVGLFKQSDYWLDGEVSTDEFHSVLAYDALTKEFTMTLPGRDGPLKNTDLRALLDQGWKTIEVTLGSWSLLDRGEKYSLRLHTSMNEKDAPQGVMRYIYFWSWDAGADNSFQLDFTF